MLFDFLPNFEKQQIQLKKKKETKKTATKAAEKKCGCQ